MLGLCERRCDRFTACRLRGYRSLRFGCLGISPTRFARFCHAHKKSIRFYRLCLAGDAQGIRTLDRSRVKAGRRLSIAWVIIYHLSRVRPLTMMETPASNDSAGNR